MANTQICEYCNKQINKEKYNLHINKHYHNDFINCDTCKGSFYKNVFVEHYKLLKCQMPSTIIDRKYNNQIG